MQDGLFFRVLRRFNTLVLTLVILAAMGLGGYAIWKHQLSWSNLFSHESEDLSLGPTVTTTTYSVMPDVYGQASPEYMRATPFLTLTRANPPSANAPQSYNSYGALDTVNVMAVDAKGQGHWLFKSSHQLITARDAVHEGMPQAPDRIGLYPAVDLRPAVALVMLVVEGDVTGADLVTGNHPPKVYVWKKGTTEAVKLLDIDASMSIGQVDAERYQIVYFKAKQTRVALYSIPDFKLISDNELPHAPK